MKIVDAKCIAKVFLYGRQKHFNYRDKPGRMLARVLAENLDSNRSKGLKKVDCMLTFQPKLKLENFDKVCSLENHHWRDMERLIHISQPPCI